MLRKLLQLLFVLGCWSGLAWIAFQTWRSPIAHTTENRMLAQKPTMPTHWQNTADSLRQFDAWWSDAIHYRQHFLRFSSLMRMKLGINPHGEVLIGKEGWFFWLGERSDEAFRNNRPLTAQEVTQWRHYLLFRSLDAKKHGAKYYFIVIPNKESAYAEYMPDNFTRLGKQSWLDQIVESLQHDDVAIIDIRNTINENKKHAQLYTKTDTHWNFLGANYAQYDITRRLAQDFPLLKPQLLPLDAFYDTGPADFVKTGAHYYTGLPFMLGISDTVNELEPLHKEAIVSCAKPAVIPLTPTWQSIPENDRKNTFHASSCDKGHYRVLFLRDSFTELLEPFMSELFHYVAYVWIGTPLDQTSWTFFLEETQPDIVLDEVIDRYLTHIPRRGIDYPENFQ